MFGLSEEISGDPGWIAARGENDSFGGSGGKIDGAIAANELLGGGHKAIAGAKDFFDARDGARAVGKRRDGLGAADARDFVNAKCAGCGQEFGAGVRAGGDDARNSREKRRRSGHHQRGYQSMAAARDVATDGFNGLHGLADANPGFDFEHPRLWQLAFGHSAHVASCMFHGA